MIVTSISTRRFAKHAAVDVTLPRKGLVLVTGKNGHGKSTLSEAVAQGVWDEPIRGKPGWRVDEKSGVRIEFDGGYVNRAVSKSKHVLTWRVGENGAGDYPTRSKAQAEFETHVGTFAVWRHACVFHTKDASVFTEATDAERKRLLEDVLELSRVEKAYRNGLKELTTARQTHRDAVHAHELHVVELAGLRAQADVLRGELEPVADLDALRSAGREVKRLLDEQRQHVQQLQAAMTAAQTRLAEKQAAVTVVRARIAKFHSMQGTCAACEQPINASHREEHLETARMDEFAALTELTDAELQHTAAAEALQTAGDALDALRAQYDENVRLGRDAVAATQRNSERQTKLGALDSKLAAAQVALQTAEAGAAEAHRALLELEAATEVLAYQGVRASMLNASVHSLQELANAWLERLGLADLKVRLSSQSVAKSGIASDKITFDVDGAGGGLGYRAASTGEQRRIDIAMLMALGELAGDSRGLSSESTLFVDELFDGLDEDGVAAVVIMLKELATKRCVVVITHSQRLITSLAPDLHLVAQDGTISGK